jgi:hypothetical protein
MAAMEFLSSQKAAITTAGTTSTIGFSQMFQWIPEDVGRLAALAGFVLTCVIIYVQILSAKKIQIEIDRYRNENGKD